MVRRKSAERENAVAKLDNMLAVANGEVMSKEAIASDNFLSGVGGNEQLVEMLIDKMSRYNVSMKEIFDTDSGALSVDDMEYFDKRFFGMVPTYGAFAFKMSKMNKKAWNELQEFEADIVGRQYETGMKQIYEKPIDELTPMDGKRFAWAEKLAKTQERKIDRLIKKQGKEGVEQGVDLALKVISALSDKQLLGVKSIMEAEWSEVEDDSGESR